MNELRRDYFQNRWVIIARERSIRPHEFAKTDNIVRKPSPCSFCPGNEALTPPEISRIEEEGRWIVRTIPNKFAATSTIKKDLSNGSLIKKTAYGRHEVIVETPDHDKTLGDLSINHLTKIFDMYAERTEENKKDPLIEYVLVFKNQGSEAGTSLEHPHSQLIALCMVPPKVSSEIEAVREYVQDKCSCPFCDIWKMEVKSERLVFEDEYSVVFTPFASEFPFQACIMPKRHTTSLEFLNSLERRSLASALKKVLSALDSSLNYPPYNFFIHSAPKGEELHLHLDICPRISRWAGFELGSGMVINTMPPETAAEHYRKVISDLQQQ